jgi:Stage II sporulation protein E (SpoIIE)
MPHPPRLRPPSFPIVPARATVTRWQIMHSRRAISFFAVIFAIALNLPLPGQTFDLAAHGRQIMALDGPMRFHPGDDPQFSWASSAFDDSSWPLIRGDQSWDAQGYPNLRGFAWYRFKVSLPDRTPSLALWVPSINTSFQIYADGRLIGEFGGMPPHARALNGQNFVFPIPAGIIHPGHPLTIALRVWSWPWFSSGQYGLQGAMQFGDADLIHEWQIYHDRTTFWQNTQSYMSLGLCLLAALGSFMLFFRRPSDREYLWFGIYELFNVALRLITIYIAFEPSDIRVSILVEGSVILGINVAFVTFILHFLKIGRNWPYWAAIAIGAFDALIWVLAFSGAISYLQFATLHALSFGPLVAAACALLFSGPKDGPSDIRALAVPLILFGASLFASNLGFVLLVNGFTWVAPYLAILNQSTTWPFPLGTFEIFNLIVQLTMFAILLLRFARTRRDEERFKNELEAARTVQGVLVPSEIPSIPGFSISSVYKPAGQVGGDFFQIIPTAGGGALVAIGDVSGKGMPAAMTVSLLIGTLRTLAHYTRRPSEILAAMNQRMLARSAGGFTTCLVLALTADGTLTMANAGHIAPYLDGRELPITNGLPLGLSASADYTESAFRIAESEQLTLMTDGVAEARARTGELLGFDRAATISTGTAESIANTAQAFGQEDDITVVTLTRIPLPASAPLRSANPTSVPEAI